MRRLLMISLLTTTAATAQVSAPLVSMPAFTGVSETLQDVALRAQTSAFAERDFRPDRNHMRDKSLVASLSRVAEAQALSVSAPPPYNQTATFQPLNAPVGVNFEALGLGTPGFTISGAPPDTTLAVSPTQIVQWVNSQFAVYNKAGVPQLPAPGFLQGNFVWQGLPAGSLCRTFNRGDPIVQYDRINQRWILSQFAFNGAFTNNAQSLRFHRPPLPSVLNAPSPGSLAKMSTSSPRRLRGGWSRLLSSNETRERLPSFACSLPGRCTTAGCIAGTPPMRRSSSSPMERPIPKATSSISPSAGPGWP